MNLPKDDKEKFWFLPDNPGNPGVITITIPIQWVYENGLEGAGMMLGMMEIYKANLDMALQIKTNHAQKNGILKALAGVTSLSEVAATVDLPR